GSEAREGKAARGGELLIEGRPPSKDSERQLPHETDVRRGEPERLLRQSRGRSLSFFEDLPQHANRSCPRRRDPSRGHRGPDRNRPASSRIPRANSTPLTSFRPERCAAVSTSDWPSPAATIARSPSSQRLPGTRSVSPPGSRPWILTRSFPRNV